MSLRSIETLRDIHTRCAAKRPLTTELQDWLARSLHSYLAHDCENLNAAFGVTQGHGGVPWWIEAGIRKRDGALLALSRAEFGDLSTYARAKAIAAMSRRYQATCWSRDRRLDKMPKRYRGTPKEHLWRAFKSGAKMPVSERRLRTILGD